LFSESAHSCAKSARVFSGFPNAFSDLFPPFSDFAIGLSDVSNAFSFQIPAFSDLKF
jgi:hypothetical protein